MSLIRLGRLDEADTELTALARQPGAGTLAGDLRRFWQHQKQEHSSDAQAPEPATAEPRAQKEPPPSAPSADFRQQLSAAARALQAGDLDTAQRLYRAVSTLLPNNTEALTGLADVARLRQDPGTARQLYDRVLEQNPDYLPALIARADQKWQNGDRPEALALYRRILEQAGRSSSYGQHAWSRIREADEQATETTVTDPENQGTPAEPDRPASPTP